MASPDAELKVRIDAELAAGFLTAFKTGAKIPKEFADKVDAELKRAAAAAAQTGQALGKGLTTGSNQAAFALTNLGRVAQDAPFGFIGIQNNLNPLLESFQRLKAETGSTGSALQALGSSLIGPAGLGVALSLVTAGILLYQQYQQRANKDTKEAANAEKDLADSIKSVDGVREEGRKLASKDLSDLQTRYKLTQDLTIPEKERLDIAKQLIKEYPKYLDGLTAEGILAGKAATQYDKLTEAILAKGIIQAGEENRQKLINQQLELSIKQTGQQAKLQGVLTAQQEINSGKRKQAIGGEFDYLNIQIEQEKALRNSKSALDETNKALEENKKQIQAVDNVVTGLVKKNGGGILDSLTDSPEKIKEKKKDIKTISDVFKELTVDIAQANNNISGTFSDQNKEKVNAYQKAIDELIKIGVDPATAAIQGLKAAGDSLNTSFDKPIVIDKLEKSMRFSFNVLPQIAEQVAKKSTESILTPLQAFNNYIGTEIFPKLQSGFESFFNDILEKGTFSFGALGQAILKTFTSVLASEATRGILSLLNPAQTQLQKGGGGGLFGLIGGLFKGGTGAAGGATAASGGALLPILGGIAAAGLIASLFKKKKSDPYIAPAAVATSNASNVGSADFNSGRVVFEISGVNLVGVLNRAGQKLQRYNV